MAKSKNEGMDEVFEGEIENQVKLDPKKVKENDLMYFMYPGFVKSKDATGENLKVDWLDKPGTFDVNGRSLVENALSADQFLEEKVVNQTECIKKLMSCYNRPFTVCWDTKDTKNRKLRGRLVGLDEERAYSKVEDLDLKEPRPKRFRKVDHRTLHWLIVDGVKYTVGRK